MSRREVGVAVGKSLRRRATSRAPDRGGRRRGLRDGGYAEPEGTRSGPRKSCRSGMEGRGAEVDDAPTEGRGGGEDGRGVIGTDGGGNMQGTAPGMDVGEWTATLRGEADEQVRPE